MNRYLSQTRSQFKWAKKHTLLSWIAALTILLSTPLLGSGKPASSVDSFTIARIEALNSTLLYVAEAKGFFAQEGLKIKFKDFASGPQTVQAMLQNQADLAVAHVSSVVRRLWAGADLTILTQLHQSTKNTAIIAREIKTPQELKGKRIAIPRGTHADFFLDLFLMTHGLNPADLQIVDLSPQLGVEALMTDKVDALVVWQPFLTYAQQSLTPAKGSLLFTDIYREASVILSRRSFATSHVNGLTRLMKALIRAEKFAQTHPLETITILSTHFKKLGPQEISSILNSLKLEIGLSDSLENLFKQQAQWISKRNSDQKILPDFTGTFYQKPLEHADPEAVTLLPEED